MRVLFVIDHYAPIKGGAERQNQLLAEQFALRGHQAGVATTWQTGLSEFEEKGGVKVYRVKGWTMGVPFFFKDPGWRRHPAPFPDPGLVLSLRRVINEFKPDVIYVYGWLVYSLSVALLGKKIPMIVSSRDYGYSCATRQLMNNGQLCSGPEFVKCLKCASSYYGMPKGTVAVTNLKLWRGLLLRKAWGFHNVSNFVRDMVQRDLLRKPANETQPNVILNTIFLNDAKAVPDQSYLDQLPKEPFILFVGTLSQHKGLFFLLDAYKKLKSPPPLVLIGIVAPDTPETYPEGVTVLREASHPTVMAAWERSLFGVVPSMWPDPLPNVVLEGMSKSKAVIGSNAGGIPDMILDHKTGRLVNIGDVDALAQAMQDLCNDPPLCAAMGTAARLHLKQWEAENAVPQFESFANQMIAKVSGQLAHVSP
jgi:glycosyltransferase involved in cell wall biosynthesis